MVILSSPKIETLAPIPIVPTALSILITPLRSSAKRILSSFCASWIASRSDRPSPSSVSEAMSPMKAPVSGFVAAVSSTSVVTMMSVIAIPLRVMRVPPRQDEIVLHRRGEGVYIPYGILTAFLR